MQCISILSSLPVNFPFVPHVSFFMFSYLYLKFTLLGLILCLSYVAKNLSFTYLHLYFFKEDKLRGKPGYEHLSEQLHILIEAEFPASIIDARLRHAQEIIEELLKPVVSY
jgi:hypothetical protein